MYIVVKNHLFHFLGYEIINELTYLICTNNREIYQFPFSSNFHFITSSRTNHNLLDLIFQKLILQDQITLTTLNSDHFNHLVIKKLNADGTTEVTDEILQKINCFNREYLWTGLIELNVENNKKITDVNFMADTLRILDAGWHCGIDQAGIQTLQLTKLNANGNKKITDVNFMRNTLRILHAGEDCGIDQGGIQSLQLTELKAWDNSKITDVNL